MQNFKPLDVGKMREIIQEESARLNLRSLSARGESSFTLALALSAAIKKIFFEKSEMTFSGEPKLERKPITQFFHTMRVDAMEKFNAPTIFSALHLAANQEELQLQQYKLTLIAYLEKDFFPDFMRLLQYPYVDFESEVEGKDACGTLVNLIAGQYKREMSLLGYKDLMMSPFESHINSAVDGVGTPEGVAEKYEISFEVEDKKRLVVELVTLDVLEKWDTPQSARSTKILLIDDDLTFVASIKPFLLSKGFEVMVAHDGKEGLAKLAWGPQLIILDIVMPGMDGYEFVIEKKKIEGPRQVPVIVLTAKEGMSDMFKVEGAREYLLKPFQPASLLKCIQRYI